MKEEKNDYSKPFLGNRGCSILEPAGREGDGDADDGEGRQEGREGREESPEEGLEVGLEVKLEGVESLFAGECLTVVEFKLEIGETMTPGVGDGSTHSAPHTGTWANESTNK